MSTIITRAGKGSALSWDEADANFTNLNTDKLEAGFPASSVANTPTGGIAATDVQTAINELDTEKVAYTRLDDSDGSSLVGYVSAGAVATTVQSKLREFVTVKDFGAVGDWNGTTGTDDRAAIQAAINYCAANRVKLRVTGGRYRIGGDPLAAIGAVDVLQTSSNLHMEFDNDAWFCPVTWNVYGGVLTNVVSSISSPVQSNVFIDNPQFDGQWLPSPVTVTGSVSGTVLTVTSSPEPRIAIGSGIVGAGITVGTTITSFGTGTGGTGTYNLSLSSAATGSIAIDVKPTGNSNAMGFANGASFFRVNGGYIRNFPFSWSVGGAGGKAVNFESGVTDSMITNISAENCGCAVFVQGKDGAANEASRIIVSNVIAKNCEAAVAVLGINTSAEPDGDAADSMVIIDGVTFYNCGHAPNRPVGSNFQKSGAIVLGEAQNVHISNVKGYNSASYPASWPSSGTVVGSGLSGPIGAVVWGWGRNITLSNIEYHGDCDSLIKINIARAIGEDGSPDGIPENVFRFDVDGLRHYGTATYVLDKQANITNANLTGTLLNIFPDTVSTGFMSSNMNGMSGIYCQLRSILTNGKSISGTADALFDGCNTFAASGAGILFKGQTVEHVGWKRTEFALADDTATSFTPNFAQGVLVISSATSALRAIVSYRADVTPQCVNMGTAVANFAVTTGVLTGTTGTDTNYTVSAANDGKIYLENRRGVTVNVSVIELG